MARTVRSPGYMFNGLIIDGSIIDGVFNLLEEEQEELIKDRELHHENSRVRRIYWRTRTRTRNIGNNETRILPYSKSHKEQRKRSAMGSLNRLIIIHNNWMTLCKKVRNIAMYVIRLRKNESFSKLLSNMDNFFRIKLIGCYRYNRRGLKRFQKGFINFCSFKNNESVKIFNLRWHFSYTQRIMILLFWYR